MEEADVLCTKIGIMSRGNLRCLGSQMHLKGKFGEGYTMKVNVGDAAEGVDAPFFVSQLLPAAKLVDHIGGNYTYQVPKAGVTISELFESMEANRNKYAITDWSVTQTTLEDVFLKIVSNDEAAEANSEN